VRLSSSRAPRSLGYVIIYVSDLDRSVAFYRDTIGLSLKFIDAGYAEFETGGIRLALYESRRAEWLTGVSPAPGPAAEIVFVVDDVDATAEQLAAAGVALLAQPTDRPWGHRTLHLADPDGFVIEFAMEIPRRRTRSPERESGPPT
jgi:lactoylglutathione lyase